MVTFRIDQLLLGVVIGLLIFFACVYAKDALYFLGSGAVFGISLLVPLIIGAIAYRLLVGEAFQRFVYLLVACAALLITTAVATENDGYFGLTLAYTGIQALLCILGAWGAWFARKLLREKHERAF